MDKEKTTQMFALNLSLSCLWLVVMVVSVEVIKTGIDFFTWSKQYG